MDAMHILKILRNLLCHKTLVGKVRWDPLEKLHNFQSTSTNDFRLANKLTDQHFDCQCSKMKVVLAVRVTQ